MYGKTIELMAMETLHRELLETLQVETHVEAIAEVRRLQGRIDSLHREMEGQNNASMAHVVALAKARQALVVAAHEAYKNEHHIVRAVWMICNYVGPSIEQEMAGVLADLKRKHMTTEVAA